MIIKYFSGAKHLSFRPLFQTALCVHGNSENKTKLKKNDCNVMTNSSSVPALCSSKIYCRGKLLTIVQTLEVLKDPKMFVDMNMKQSPEKTLALFDELMVKFSGSPSKEDLKKFVDENFEGPGKELVDWIPSDWKQTPEFVHRIKDSNYFQWACHLNALWREFGRQLSDDVFKHSERYSFIPIPNPFIAPGGRFFEYYYWDTYWIIRGLIHSEMYRTIKGMLENFLWLINRFGFIPNGGRLYYTERSQPPLFTGMVKSYLDATDDTEFMHKALPFLEIELSYFLNNYMVNVNGYDLAVYGRYSPGPRPESYVNDAATAANFASVEEQENMYLELKAAAETGMDFSSRCFIKDGTNEGDLTNIKCRSIVAVDLNAILFQNAKLIAEFHKKTGNTNKSAKFEAIAQNLYQAIQAVLWNEDVGVWLDYDLINKKSRNYFVPTNLSPLWSGCFDSADRTLPRKILNYIQSTGIESLPGGIPQTLRETGQQWDFPDAWPPMQDIVVKGLLALNDEKANELAYSFATRWIQSNFAVYQRTGKMFEKYSAIKSGSVGSGGEYKVQTGFGWSNGVILEFLTMYGDRLNLAGVQRNATNS